MSTTSPSRPDFLFLGGHPAIDFANTLAQAPGPGTEYLQTWEDVIDWLKSTGLSDGENLDSRKEASALDAVRSLRQAWKKVIAGIIAGKAVPANFVAQINSLLEPDLSADILLLEKRGEIRLRRTPSQLEGAPLALAILARCIAEYLSTADLEYLRRCANHESCVLTFYDTTKNHRRQWCSNALCGNRHKVAEFRKRRRVKQ